MSDEIVENNIIEANGGPGVTTEQIQELFKKFETLNERIEKSERENAEYRAMNQALSNTNAALARLIPVGNKKTEPSYTVPDYDELEKCSTAARFKIAHQLAMDSIEGGN